MRVLVLGGAGYIGSHVVLELLEAGHHVTVADNLELGSRNNLFDENVFIQGDLRHRDFVESLFKDTSFDVVIHLSAYKRAGDSTQEIGSYSVNNIAATSFILDSMQRHGVSSFIFSSTAAVYGKPQYLPLDEDHPCQPENFYGQSKLMVEHLLQWYQKAGLIRSVALRYFNAAGYDVKGRLRQKEINPTNLIPVIMEVALGQRSELLIFGSDYQTSDGSGARDYIHVSDLARAHLAALDYLAAGHPSVSLNLGTGRSYTVLELVSMARSITGRDIPYKIVDRRSGDVDIIYASSANAYKVLSWEAQESDLEHIMRTSWAALKDGL